MNYLFEYKTDKKDYINYSKLLYRATPRVGYWLSLIFVACFLVYLYVTYGKYLLQGYRLSVLIWALLIIYPLFLLYYIFLPRILGLRWEKERRYKGMIRACFDDNGITSDTELDHAVSSYQCFTKLFHWRETYFMFSGKNSAWILPERGLVEGDLASFGAFLEQKTGLKIKELK